MGEFQTAREHVFRERPAFGFEELMDIARRHGVACGDLRDRQVYLAQMARDIRFDRLQSRRAHAADLRLCRRVLMGADAQCDEVKNMR